MTNQEEQFQNILMSPTDSSIPERPHYSNPGPDVNSGGNNHKGGISAVDLVRRYIESLPQQVPFNKEIRSGHFWKAVWTEFIGTMLFVVIGCGSGIRWSSATGNNDQASSSVSEDLKASLAIGFTMAALVHSAAHISGCHLNPAVSITLLVTRVISPLRTASYACAQCLGAIVGAAVLYALSPVEIRQSAFPVTVLQPNIHPTQAFGVEFLITLLVIITLIATYETQNSETGLKGMSVGVAYTVGHLFGCRYTGASMNPARSFGLALITNTWANQWVYWVGPILGGIIGGITYEYIRTTKECYVNGYGEWNGHSVHLQHKRYQQQQQQLISARNLRRDQSSLDAELTANSNDLRV